jgi:hypothetical protein
MSLTESDRAPSFLELESVQRMPVVALITSLSPDTLKRRYPELVVHLSERRVGMKLRHALEIAASQK